MSLEELVSLERIENFNNIRLKETYLVYNLPLSKLFVEVLEELKKDIFPVLDIHILLYSLRFVPFTDEAEGLEAFKALKACLDKDLYGSPVQWTSTKICNNLEKLCELIVYEYFIEGSLIVYHNYEIEWDLSVCISPPS
ncbi:MAG: hypothetical protein KGD58_05240 [Candidatus Lokiarchaeota archaeon]|nr:hypothetical protein [Candidatus Lokiarchaeota archaeon]